MLIRTDLVESHNRIVILGVVNTELFVWEVSFQFCCPHSRHRFTEFARGDEIRVRLIIDFFNLVSLDTCSRCWNVASFKNSSMMWVWFMKHSSSVLHAPFSTESGPKWNAAKTQPCSSMKSGQKTCSSTLAIPTEACFWVLLSIAACPCKRFSITNPDTVSQGNHCRDVGLHGTSQQVPSEVQLLNPGFGTISLVR